MVEGLAAEVRRIRRGELSWTGLVSEQSVDAACQRAGYRSRAVLFNPSTTIVTFLTQLIGSDGSCQEAVDGLIAERVSAGEEKNSADTGGYCKARKRLPEEVYQDLARRSGRAVEEDAGEAWLWQGHRVRIADGSTLHVHDTEANLQEYPLQRTLRPGLHYAVVRILVVFSLAVGTVLEGAIRPWQGKGTGETAMLRELADRFHADDVLLADCYFSGYWDVAFWMLRGVHLVTRMPASRRADFRRGKRLGQGDHLVGWNRTARPDWISRDEAAHVPGTLLLREVRIHVPTKGFRTKVVDVVTTLLDAQRYPKEAIAALYRRRWQAELNLRSLKTHMAMDYLRCKTPEMVRREFAMYLLAYNTIRRVAAEAARSSDRQPCEMSFSHTRQSITQFLPRLHGAVNRDHWLAALLANISEVLVGNRPDRIEPYTCKTRPKDYPPPKQTRTAYKSRKLKQK